jgi:hypothetical protein
MALAILLYGLYSASSLLIAVKRLEVKAHVKQRAATAAGDTKAASNQKKA